MTDCSSCRGTDRRSGRSGAPDERTPSSDDRLRDGLGYLLPSAGFLPIAPPAEAQIDARAGQALPTNVLPLQMTVFAIPSATDSPPRAYDRLLLLPRHRSTLCLSGA